MVNLGLASRLKVPTTCADLISERDRHVYRSKPMPLPPYQFQYTPPTQL